MRSSASILIAMACPLALAAQDTLVVRADNPAVWGASVRLVEELRIGVLDGDPRYVLGNVVGVLEAPDSTIWIADDDLGAIRRYTSSGEHLDDVGRRGQGPGEFNRITGMRLLPDGRVAVLDPFNIRIHLFGLDGKLLEALRSPTAALMGGVPLEVDTAGSLFVHDVTDERRRVWVVVSSRGEVRDTIPIPAADRAGYDTSTQSHLSPLSYFVEGRNDRYVFFRPLRDGRVVRIERSWTPVPYEAGERGELQKRAEATAAFTGNPVRGVPAAKAPWSSFWLDTEGRIWVQPHRPAVHLGETEGDQDRRRNLGRGIGMPVPAFPPINWKEPATYDVIAPTGTFLGSVTVPNAVRALGSSTVKFITAMGMTVWTVETGVLDEQYVVKYRVEPG